MSRQTRNSPIIVGDHYELAETVALQDCGESKDDVVVKTDDQAALLPMSGYEKPQDANVNEYDTRGTSQTYSNFPNQNAHYPSQGQAYLHYTLPGAADSQLQSVSKTYDQNADQMAFGASSNIQSRAQHEATQSTYDELEPRGFPGVSSYAPQRGSQGCLVSIYLDSPNDLINPSPFVANMIFATRSAPAAIHRLETRDYDIYYKYVVIATAPAFAETASSVARIPLRLQLQQQSGLHARLLDVGPWLYDDSKRFELGSPLQESRKRKVGGLPDPSRSTKRVTPTDPQAAVSQGYASYNNGTSSLAYPGSLHSSMDFSAMQRKYTPYGRSHMQQSFQDSGIMMDAQTLNATSQSLMSPPTGQASWNSPLSSAYQSRKSPTPKPTFQISSTSSPNPACPQLVRTSTLQQQPNSVSTSAGSSSDGNFNHYALYPPNRAVLKIQGDVNLMQDNWTPEERSLKRRLVRFWREQSGSTINAYFNAVKPDERPQPLQQHERRISCIYWEERQEYYVTSVDTISLLESLVDQRFTVEEKNRIRRNLEGFKPETVSKTKPETESFFKLVMGFPNPKPRNIEKDVKAFPWPILAQALKKIISKYSASYSSTAGPLTRSPSSTYGGTPSSQSRSNHYTALSSRSTSDSALSSAYAPTLKSSTLSPATASHGLSHYPQASPLQSISGLSHSYTVPHLGSQYIPSDDNSKQTISTSYVGQVSIPSLSQVYHTSTIGRRRSSDIPIDTLGSTQYTRRPRANTSFSSQYAPQDLSDFATRVVLPGRASFDFSSYLTGGTDEQALQQYRRESGAGADEAEGEEYEE